MIAARSIRMVNSGRAALTMAVVVAFDDALAVARSLQIDSEDTDCSKRKMAAKNQRMVQPA